MGYRHPGEKWLRRVILRPYFRGKGPHFILTLWDAEYRHGDGKWSGRDYISYSLEMVNVGRTGKGRSKVVLFSGNDYSPSPGYSIDGDKCLAGLLGFLTLRPGDTDPDYFESYTPEQLAYCDEHAEALHMEAIGRFGED